MISIKIQRSLEPFVCLDHVLVGYLHDFNQNQRSLEPFVCLHHAALSWLVISMILSNIAFS